MRKRGNGLYRFVLLENGKVISTQFTKANKIGNSYYVNGLKVLVTSRSMNKILKNREEYMKLNDRVSKSI